MDEGTGSRHATVKRARTVHAQRPSSYGRDSECTPVGLGLKQKKPASAPDASVLKRISATLEQSDNPDDCVVSYLFRMSEYIIVN